MELSCRGQPAHADLAGGGQLALAPCTRCGVLLGVPKIENGTYGALLCGGNAAGASLPGQRGASLHAVALCLGAVFCKLTYTVCNRA